jgi:hypothetical protein
VDAIVRISSVHNSAEERLPQMRLQVLVKEVAITLERFQVAARCMISVLTIIVSFAV